MAKEVKERTPSSFNSKFGFESEFTFSSGHSQDHLEMVSEQGEYGELPNSLPLTPDPHPKTTVPLLRPLKQWIHSPGQDPGPYPASRKCDDMQFSVSSVFVSPGPQTQATIIEHLLGAGAVLVVGAWV